MDITLVSITTVKDGNNNVKEKQFFIVDENKIGYTIGLSGPDLALTVAQQKAKIVSELKSVIIIKDVVEVNEQYTL